MRESNLLTIDQLTGQWDIAWVQINANEIPSKLARCYSCLTGPHVMIHHYTTNRAPGFNTGQRNIIREGGEVCFINWLGSNSPD